METYFCPKCWHDTRRPSGRCFVCGYDFAAHSRLPFEKKLILALRHPVMENRLMAIRTLGELKEVEALPHLETILKSEKDSYVLREAIFSLSKIDTPKCWFLIEQATRHRSRLLSKLAQQLLEWRKHARR